MGLKFVVKDKKMQKIMQRKEYFKSHIRWMIIVGIWPLNIFRNEMAAKWATLVWEIIWQLISIHITALHIYTLRNRIIKGGTLDDFSGILMSTMVYSYTYYITIHFQLRHKGFRQLVDFLCENVRLRSAYGLTYLTIEASYHSFYRKTMLWVCMCVLGTLHWSVTPLLTSRKVLPLDIEYPFDPTISPRYEVLYFLQVLGQIQVAVAFGISSGLYMSAVLMVSGQFDILFCSLKNLRCTAMILKGDYKAVKYFESLYISLIYIILTYRDNFRVLQDLYDPLAEEQSQYEHGTETIEDLEIIKSSSETDNMDSIMIDRSRDNNSPIRKLNLKSKDKYLLEYRDELHIALVDCVRHHQIIKKMIDTIEDSYFSFAFTKLFQVSFLICFLTFIVSRTTEINMQLVNLLEYLSLTSSELLLFCYFGELISRQSVRITDAVMRSPWYLCNGSFRRSLLIMMSCVLRPIHLTAGKFYTLNIETFRSVVTASFSYYTLLKNIGEH